MESNLKFPIEYYEYLDGLRESGETNMFGARPYLMQHFLLSKQVAGEVLKDWMETFETRHREAK